MEMVTDRTNRPGGPFTLVRRAARIFGFFRTLRVQAAVIAVASILLSCVSAVAGHGDGLTGEAFSDPSYRVGMPREWKSQPIRYEAWAKGDDLAVSLDQFLYSLYEPLIREYAAKHGLKIAVTEGTCGISAGMLSRKAADVAGFCCPPGPSDRLPGLAFHTVGIAAVTLIVHPSNPVDSITAEQARSIYMGDVYSWSEIKPTGWKGKPPVIRTVGRLHCKTRPGHWRLLLDNEDLFSIRLQEVGTIPDMIALVAKNPGAIGYEALWMTSKYENLGKVKPLKIDGVSPYDGKALAAGQYPFYRTFGITTWEEPGLIKPEAKKLVEFLKKSVPSLDSKFALVPADALRKAGWKFLGDELVAGPDRARSGR